MVISEQLAGMLCQQVANELANRNLYMMFSNWFHVQGLKRLAAFFKGEADGELTHSEKFREYLNEANAPLAIPAVEKKPSGFDSCDTIANLYIAAEAQTTKDILAMWEQTVKDNDIGSQDCLQPMLREQVEEESLAEKFGNLVDLANGDLLKLDLMFD